MLYVAEYYYLFRSRFFQDALQFRYQISGLRRQFYSRAVEGVFDAYHQAQLVRDAQLANARGYLHYALFREKV